MITLFNMIERDRQLEREQIQRMLHQKQNFDLEVQQELEKAKKYQESSLQKYAIKSAQGVKGEFLGIMRIVQDTGDCLRYIQSYCSNKMTNEAGQQVASYVDELRCYKTDLKNESYRVRKILLNEKIVHKDIHGICKDYLKKFEDLMDRQAFVDLCTQLISAIDNKETAEIQMFGKLAGHLSDDLKRSREEIMEQLDKISVQNSQKSIQYIE